MSNQIKNNSELQDLLLSQINTIKSGAASLQGVSAINQTARNLISSVKLDVQYRLARGEKPELEFLNSK